MSIASNIDDLPYLVSKEYHQDYFVVIFQRHDTNTVSGSNFITFFMVPKWRKLARC